MAQPGKLKAWSGACAFYGNSALGITQRQGSAKMPKRSRAPMPAAAPLGSEELRDTSAILGNDDATEAQAGHVAGNGPDGGASALGEGGGGGGGGRGGELPDDPAVEAALLQRSGRLFELLKGADVRLPAGMPAGGQVLSEDNALLFVARFARMLAQRGPEAAAPKVAFHWTAEANFQSIAESNLRVPDGASIKKKHGAAFGRGIYASPDFRFAKEDFSYGASATFMCLVLIGKQEYRQPRSHNNSRDISHEFDSVKGRMPGRHSDTWVLPESEQVLPCFLVDEVALGPASDALRRAIALLREPWPPALFGGSSGAGAAAAGAGGGDAGPAGESGAGAGGGEPSAGACGSSGGRARWCRRGQGAAVVAPADIDDAAGSEANHPKRSWRGAARAARVARAAAGPLATTAATTTAATKQPRAGGGAEDAAEGAAEAVITVASDILHATEPIIAHQCCCVLSRSAEGVAAAIFERYTEADIYRERRERGRPIDTPGRISLHGRIANIYSQFCPGRPMAHAGLVPRSAYAECFARFPGVYDTREERLAWFRQGLEKLADRLPEGPRALALPARIGCGLAAGHWPSYLEAIRDFARRRGVAVSIYDWEARLGEPSASTGQVARAPAPMRKVAAAAPFGLQMPIWRPSFWKDASLEVRDPNGDWVTCDDKVSLLAALLAALRAARSPPPAAAEAAGERGAVEAGAPTLCLEPDGVLISGPTLGSKALRLRPSLAPAAELVLPRDLDEEGAAPELGDWSTPITGRAAVQHCTNTGAEASCTICLSHFWEDADSQVRRLQCGHLFHDGCLSRWFDERLECPTCKHRFGTIVGNQPRIGSLAWTTEASALPGSLPQVGTIVVSIYFPRGVDEQGSEFAERREKAYLPDDARGRLLLALFQLAFRRRVLFGLGLSMKLGIRRATFNIHLKTARRGGPTLHGYPDDAYFERCLEELHANGVAVEQLQ